MRVLLKIGYEEIILPNDAGVPTLMKVLGKALRVSRDHRYSDNTIIVNSDPPTVSIELLSPKVRLVKAKDDADEETESEILALPEITNALVRRNQE